jgi:hypothetical protein
VPPPLVSVLNAQKKRKEHPENDILQEQQSLDFLPADWVAGEGFCRSDKEKKFGAASLNPLFLLFLRRFIRVGGELSAVTHTLGSVQRQEWKTSEW